MSILKDLSVLWEGLNKPVLISNSQEVFFEEIYTVETAVLNAIKSGDVVALVGDFNSVSIAFLLRLIDIRAIVVPLTDTTKMNMKLISR